MDTLWAPPQLSLLNNNFVDYYGPPGGHHHHQQELVSPTPNFYESHQLFVPHDSFKEGKGGLDYGSGCGMSENHQQQQHLAPPMKLARSGSVVASTSANIGMPKCQQPKQRQMQKGNPRVESDQVIMSQSADVHHQQPTMDGCRLVVLRQAWNRRNLWEFDQFSFSAGRTTPGPLRFGGQSWGDQGPRRRFLLHDPGFSAKLGLSPLTSSYLLTGSFLFLPFPTWLLCWSVLPIISTFLLTLTDLLVLVLHLQFDHPCPPSLPSDHLKFLILFLSIN